MIKAFCLQTASSLIKGLERGQYHIKTTDLVVNLLLTSMSNITPSLYPLVLEVLLAPLLVIILAIYGKVVDGIVIKGRRNASAREASGYVAPNEAQDSPQ